MAADRHPLLADTSALIAVANTDLWEQLCETLAVTTTNVCVAECKRHADIDYPATGSREAYLQQGSQRVLSQLRDDDSAWSVVTVVPRPHGPDAGEQSLRQEAAAHPNAYSVISLLDGAGRRSIRRELADHDIDVVGPPYLLYLLFATDHISKAEFCRATVEMIRTEGWIGYEAVKAAWEGIPVDCAELLGEEYDDALPPR